MSLTGTGVKLLGLLLAIAGLLLVFAGVGLFPGITGFGTTLELRILTTAVGALMLGSGVIIVRGGTITS